ncbi:MAG: hypothetical protein M1826_003052 [Phylliscum demangeonii]|nr:MAG: hypothetical protein M1826_003052 [Phylliscum demangeonii]
MVRFKSRYLLVHILYPSLDEDHNHDDDHDREPGPGPAPTLGRTTATTTTTTPSLLASLAPPPPPPPPPKSHSTQIPDMIRFHRPTPSTLTIPILLRLIRAHIGTLYGDYGVGVTGSSLSIKYFSPATSTFIVRVGRDHYRLVWAVLAFSVGNDSEGAD